MPVLLLASCGYSTKSRLVDVFKGKEGIYIPVFTNLTDEVGAERVFTNALIRELQSRGEVIVTHRGAGGYEFAGTVVSIGYGASGNTTPGFGGLATYRRIPSEMAVDVAVSMQLLNPKTGRVLWAGSFSGFRRVAAPLDRTYDYEAPSSLGLITQSLIESQYPYIARDIVRDAYDTMLEFF